MASPEELFRSLIGRPPTDQERIQIMTLRTQTGAPDDDAMWIVMIGMGYAAGLFETLPDKIAATTDEFLTRVEQTAQTVIAAAAHKTQADFVDTINAQVQRVARATVWAQKWKWLTLFAIVLVALLLVAMMVIKEVHATGFQAGLAKGYGQGFNEGYQKNRNEQDAAAWGNTREGRLARQFYRRNSEFFFKLLECTGEGWQERESRDRKAAWCFAGPYQRGYSEEAESWRIR